MSTQLSELSYIQVSNNEQIIDQTNELMILSHGYGSNGHNLADLAKFLAPFFPNAVFICPNAPELAEANNIDMQHPSRLQWFSLADRSVPALSLKVTKSGAILSQFVINCVERLNTPYNKVALLGFSQGTYVSIQASLTLPQQIGGIIGCSGSFIKAAAQLIQDAQKSNVILIHGDNDDVIPHYYSETAQKDLTEMGHQCELSIIKNLGHCITPKVMKKIVTSLQQIWN